MYTNVKQHCNCQSQNNFSTLNITLTELYLHSREGRLISGNNNGTIQAFDTKQAPITENGEPVLKPIMTFRAHNDCVNGIR